MYLKITVNLVGLGFEVVNMPLPGTNVLICIMGITGDLEN